MSKKNNVKPPVSTRTAVPKVVKDEHGANILMCPFCAEPHPVSPYVPSPCGTRVVVTAEQPVFKAKYNEKMICAKCHKGGGTMVLWHNAFIHTPDCDPSIRTPIEPPKFSRLAEWVYHRNGFIRSRLEDIFGKVMAVEEVQPDGTLTGVILGYYFQKENKNGKHTQTDPGGTIPNGGSGGEQAGATSSTKPPVAGK